VLKSFDIKLARDLDWQELQNEELLTTAEEHGFEVLLTADKSMPDEQNIASRKIGIVAMSTNGWEIVRGHVPEIAEALHKCKPGQVLPVFCGEFSRYKATKSKL
jgi:hypothetical protein